MSFTNFDVVIIPCAIGSSGEFLVLVSLALAAVPTTTTFPFPILGA